MGGGTSDEIICAMEMVLILDGSEFTKAEMDFAEFIRAEMDFVDFTKPKMDSVVYYDGNRFGSVYQRQK